MTYEIRRAGTQSPPLLPPALVPPAPVEAPIAPAAPVNEEHHVVVRREIVVHEHYARMGDGTLIAILPPGAKPAYTSAQAHQPQQIEVLTRPMLAAPPGSEIMPALLALPAPIATKQRKRKEQKAASPLFLLITLLLACAAVSVVIMPLFEIPAESSQRNDEQTKAFVPHAQQPQPQAPEGPLAPVGVLQGPNSLTPDHVNDILSGYNSPAADQGQAFYKLGQRYGIDDAYPVAFFIHESTAGTASGWAGLKADGTTTHNIGNIICANYGSCYNGFRDYPTWEAGIEDWYKLITVEYIQGRGFKTVADTTPVYCPVADGCNPEQYVSLIEHMVTEWRAKYPAASQAAPAPDSFVALTRCEKRADGWHVVGTIQNTGTDLLDIAFKDVEIHDTQTSDSFATGGDGATRVAAGQRAPIDITVPLKDGHSYMIVFERPSGSIPFPISDLYYCGIQPTR